MSATQSQALLHDNVQNFWDKFFEKYNKDMHCKQGCSACCHVDLGVFPSEAARIMEWFNLLTQEQQAKLCTAWKTAGAPQPNANGKKQNPCAFLSQNSCTIYEVRPTICRTQGLPLMFREENLKTKETILHVDVCPLNFTVEHSLPLQAEWLDLDRLNALQSIASRQMPDSENNQFLPLQDKNQRVLLRNLRNRLAGF